MKSILYVLQDVKGGGQERRVLQSARELRKKEYGVAVVLPTNTEVDMSKEFSNSGISTHKVVIVRLKETLNPLYFIKWVCGIVLTVWSILKIINNERIDIVYVNQITQIQAAIAAKLSKRKLIWHLIDLNYPNLLEAIFFPFVRAFADKIVVSCEYGARLLKERRKFHGDIYVLHAPADISRFMPDLNGKRVRAELMLGDNLVVGLVANIASVKGIEYFIQAAALIKEKYPTSRFLIVGQKLQNQLVYYQKLKKLVVELSLEDNVLFTGYRKDIPEIMAAIDVFALTSLSEASPLVLLEAMASGKSVVASRVGGIPEIVVDNKTGILVPARDAGSISQAILYLFSDEQIRRKMGEKGIERVRNHFSLEVVTQRLINLIESLAE